MDIGELDQQVTLQKLTETNTSGELVGVWTNVAKVWAKVISQKGGEAFEAARLNATDTIRVCMRYRTDITPAFRLTWGTQTYSITNVDRSARRQGEIWVTAQAVGAA